MKLYPRSHLP